MQGVASQVAECSWGRYRKRSRIQDVSFVAGLQQWIHAGYVVGPAEVAEVAATGNIDDGYSDRRPIHHNRARHKRTVASILIDEIRTYHTHFVGQTGTAVPNAAYLPSAEN